MLSATGVMHFLTHEGSGLSRGGLTLALGFSGALQCSSFRHRFNP
jgi:hypothetical protein